MPFSGKHPIGRGASGPPLVPNDIRVYWRIGRDTWQEAAEDNISLVAAGVAFYAFLALVPSLAILLLCYGLFADPGTVADHLRLVFSVMPRDAAQLVSEQLISLTHASTGRSGAAILVSSLVALYGVSNATWAMLSALNVAFDVEESRGMVRATILSIEMALGLLAIAVLTLLAIAAMVALKALIVLPPLVELIGRIGFWGVAASAATLTISLIFRHAPNRGRVHTRLITLGAAAATIGWIATSVAFSFYTTNLTDYNATYGALGTVAVTLMWLYLSAYALLFGAELDAVLAARQA